MNEYEAKFEREAKQRPKDWIIVPGREGFKLVYLGDNRHDRR